MLPERHRVVVGEQGLPQRGLEQPLVVGEVIPHRPGDDVASVAGAPEVVDDARDGVGGHAS